jgi:O-antigen ligase
VLRATIMLVLALLASVVISPSPQRSLPALLLTLYGIGVLWACIGLARSRRADRWLTPAVLCASVGLAALGLLNTTRPPAKLFDASEPYALLAGMAAAIGSSGTLSPNVLGGALTIPLPLTIALLVGPGSIAVRTGAAICGLLLSAALVLTQSRGALAAVVCALVIGGVARLAPATRWRFVRWPALVALLFVLASVGIVVRDWLVDVVRLGGPVSLVTSLGGRAELWRRGVLMMLDMPASGIGLSSFPRVLQEFYPTLNELDPSVTEHVHNQYLQLALDHGPLGLTMVLMLAALAVRTGLSARCSESLRASSARSAGLLLGLLAFAIFGLTDSVVFGVWPSWVVWAALGLLLGTTTGTVPAVVHRTRRPMVPRALTVVLLLAAPLFVGPLMLNAAWIVLHRTDRFDSATGAALTGYLNVASRFAWGPFQARAWAARASAGLSVGDNQSARDALLRAVNGAPWDPTLAVRLADLELAHGDADAAVRAWRTSNLVEVPLARGLSSPPDSALAWFELARQVDPSDWRPYVGAARKLAETGEHERADELVAQAVELGGDAARKQATAYGLARGRTSSRGGCPIRAERASR